MTSEAEHWLRTMGPKADVYGQQKEESDVEKIERKKNFDHLARIERVRVRKRPTRIPPAVMA